MGSPGGQLPYLECRLERAHDLAAILTVLQLKEKEKEGQRIFCQASSTGLKLTAQSAGKDVAIHAWMFSDAFREYKYVGNQEMTLKLPLAPLLNCLGMFGERSSLVLCYPSGPSDELRFKLEEDGAMSECCLRTLVLDDAPAQMEGSFFAPTEPMCIFEPLKPEVWHQALSEFDTQTMNVPDAQLHVSLKVSGPTVGSVNLRAATLESDSEVVIPAECLRALNVPQEISASGEVAHRYHVSSVLACCHQAAKQAKGVKVRFNKNGAMSNQFILPGREQKQLFVESLVSPLADLGQAPQLLGHSGGANNSNPYANMSAPAASID